MTLLSLYGQKSSLALHRSAGIIGSDHLPNAVSSNVAIGNPVWMDSEMGKSLVGKWWIVQFFVWWHQHLCWSISNHNSHIYIYKYTWKFHMLNEASESVCSHHFKIGFPSPLRNEKCFRRSGKRFGTREPSCNVRFLCGGWFFLVQKSGDFMRTWNSIRKNEAFSKSGKSHRNFAEITSSHQFGS